MKPESLVEVDPLSPKKPAERTVALLSAFAEQPRWGVRELAVKVGYPKSSVHRILQDLATDGFLSEDAGAYRVTPTLLKFALDLAQSFHVPRVAIPHLEKARDDCGETTIMVLYDRGRRQVSGVAAAESLRAVRFSADAMRPFFDLHVGAPGKAVLAFLPPEEQRRVLKEWPDPVPGQLGQPTVSKAQLRKELRETKARGWSIGHAQDLGIRAVAAPVYGSEGAVIGAVLIAWPDNAAPEGEFGPLAQRTAAAVSSDLGGVQPQ